jgi:hypothetical protein
VAGKLSPISDLARRLNENLVNLTGGTLVLELPPTSRTDESPLGFSALLGPAISGVPTVSASPPAHKVPHKLSNFQHNYLTDMLSARISVTVLTMSNTSFWKSKCLDGDPCKRCDQTQRINEDFSHYVSCLLRRFRLQNLYTWLTSVQIAGIQIVVLQSLDRNTSSPYR